MKKFFKILGILFIVVLVSLYIEFLLLPRQIDLNQYKPLIKEQLKNYTDLNIDISDIKLITEWNLQAGALVSDIEIKLPDDSVLYRTACIKAKLSLINLLLLNVKLSDVSIYKPYINIEIENGNKFKVVDVIESKLGAKEKEQDIDTLTKKEEGFNILSLIRYNAPNINIYDYRLAVNDKKSGEYLILTGEKLKLAYLNGERLKIKTDSKLLLNQDEKIGFNINFDTFLPKPQELDEEDDPEVRNEVPFVNPVLTYKKYDPKGKLDAKFKLDYTDKGLKGIGHINLDDITFNIDGYQIPESYIRTKIRGKKTFIDSNFAFSKRSRLNLSGFYKISKHPHFKFNIMTDAVYLDDVVSLIRQVSDSLQIESNLDFIEGKGKLSANADIFTNSSRLKSNGYIKIENGSITDKKSNLGLNNINFNVLLDNDTLSFDKAQVNINEGKLELSGFIDKHSNTDLAITSGGLSLPVLYRAFAPNSIKNQIDLKNGIMALDVKMKGKLKNAITLIGADIKNFLLTDKLGTYVITNDHFQFKIKDENKLKGTLSNKGFKIALPYASSAISNDTLTIPFDEKDITINPFNIKINNNSIISVKGDVKDYLKNPKFDISAKGAAQSLELKKLLGPVAEPFVAASGTIPVKLSFTGDTKKQTLRAQVKADSKNYITPVNINSISNRQTIMQAFVDFKRNRIKIKDTGLFVKYTPDEFMDDLALNMMDTTPVMDLKGTISGLDTKMPSINLLKLESKSPISFSIVGLKDSHVKANANISVFGNLDSPRTKGSVVLSEIAIPNLALAANQIKFLMNGKEGKISTDGLIVNDSDIKFNSNINLARLPLIALFDTNINSENIDCDKLIEVSDRVTKLIPPDPVARPAQDIPAQILAGKFKVKTLKTGNIVAQNVNGNLLLNENILYISNLILDIFKGKVGGDVDINLLTFLVNANIKGNGLDADEALITLADLKDTLSGKLSFDTDVSLQGLTYEQQVKSLKGVFNFLVENGQAGPFGKIENIFLSENLRQSELFQNAIGQAVSNFVTFDTSRFTELKGNLEFNNGVADINEITMEGGSLCILIFGNMDILANTLDAKVRGRLGSMVSSVLGPLANVNPVNIVKATPGLNVVMAKAFSVFCEPVTQGEMDAIPDFTKDKSDFNATKFQIVLRGDVAKPLSMLKSFKWLATQEEIDEAEQFASSIPDNLPPEVSSLEELKAFQAQQEKEAKSLKGRMKNFFKKFKKTESV